MSPSPIPPCAPPPPCPLPSALQAALPVLEHLLEPVVIVDDARRIVHANTAFLRAIGSGTLAEVLGLRLGDGVKCVHATETSDGCGSSPACRLCGGFLSQQAALSGDTAVEDCRVARVDGRTLCFKLLASPWNAGDRHFLLLSARDTSAEQRLHLHERWLFHGLRDTAGGIVGYADYLARELTGSVSAPGLLTDSITRLSRQMFDAIETQCCLALAEGGNLKCAPEPCEPELVLQALADQFANHPAAAERRIVLEPPAGPLPELCTDGVILLRVLGFLLLNALEASRTGGAVALAAEQRDDGVEFRVHNAGPISRDTQLQVFQLGFSTKGAGRGLGTYGARLLGEQVLGGRVGFSSNDVGGTVFRVWLPRRFGPPVQPSPTSGN